MHRRFAIGFTILLGFPLPVLSQAPSKPLPKTELPKVVLIGDSIRLGYAPLVARRLAGKAVVVSPKANGGDSGNVLKNLDEWVIREKPAVVHFNCGLHDLKFSPQTMLHQVKLAQYESNLKQIVARLRKETSANLVFANTTPILDGRHAKRGAGFDRFEADVERYNRAALAVMREAGVPVHDLHWIVEQGGPETMLGADGTHYTPAGYDRLAEAEADCVLRQLYVVRHPGGPAPVPDPQAAARYQKAQAERDALVPKAYKELTVGSFQVPPNAEAWQRQRPAVLKTVLQSLGDLPPRPSPSRARVVSRELRRDYTLERVTIANTEASDVTALLLIPEKRQQPAPAILWLHSSTPDKNQILTPNTNGGAEPLGETLVRAGYVVLAPDACWYGDRADQTPAGAAEVYRREDSSTIRSPQESLLKFNLWMGRSLWGMFVRDDQVALDYLCSRPEVDKARIGATGMSMGSTRAWWLAAVDDRIAAVVAVACLTRYQNLIAHGELRAHGVYYFVYGLLKHFDTEGVVALIAPAPFLALTGELDRGPPADGIKVIEEQVSRVYAAAGVPERFKSILYPNTGHTYTPQMRAEMLAWFERWLKPH
jgi:lysophospholipase L1-like esterase/dienelactone hydrolase